MPAIGRVDVAGSKGASLQIAELVEHKQGMVAGATKVAVVSASFLIAEGWADTGVHVQHDRCHWTALSNAVDPLPDNETSDPRLSGRVITSVSKRPI